jgi:hypothetical protein
MGNIGDELRAFVARGAQKDPVGRVVKEPLTPRERKRTDDSGENIHHLVVGIKIFFRDELDAKKDHCDSGDGEKIRDGAGTCFHSSTIPKPD